MFRRLNVHAAMAAAVFCACAPAMAAPGGLLDGELGRWLESEAVPKLLVTLDRHPRFRGETLRIVPMHHGEPVSASDRLNLTIQRTLEHRLVQTTGVRIATQGSPGHCDIRTDVSYLLGVEVGDDGPNRHRVHLAIADVEEGIWVNGASESWSGRLTSAQRAALRERVSVAQPGTMTNPLSIQDAVAVANALYGQLTCDLRSVPTSEVRLVSDEQQLDGVKRHVDTRLRASTELRSVATTGASVWTLRIRSTATLESQRDVILELEDPTGGHPTQRLASVTVTGAGPGRAPTPMLAAPGEQAWLSELRYQTVRNQGVCAGRTDALCMEVTVQLHQPIYLLVFQTNGTRIDVPACGKSAKRREGERRFRFALTDAGGHNAVADGGFYALATDRPGVARALQRHLAEAPGACRGKRNPATMDAWLEQLDLLLSQHGGAIQWQAVHLERRADQVVSL